MASSLTALRTAPSHSAQGAMNGGNGTEATALWGLLEEGLSNATDAVDWYNVLLHHVPDDAAAANGLVDGAVKGSARISRDTSLPSTVCKCSSTVVAKRTPAHAYVEALQ